MKKILLTVFICLAFTYSQAQYDYSSALSPYKPLYQDRSYSNSQSDYSLPPTQRYEPQPEQPRYVKTSGYYYDKQKEDYVRIKIIIGSNSLYRLAVIAYYSPNIDQWISLGGGASKVSASIDGQVIADNFEWKASVNGREVYFNN